jgi:hypothetical protein
MQPEPLVYSGLDSSRASAPCRMVLLNASWNPVAIKRPKREIQLFEMSNKDRKVIARITGIAREVLSYGEQLRSFSVAERMSWATRRNTTRQEDQAYCLISIFFWASTCLCYMAKAMKRFSAYSRRFLNGMKTKRLCVGICQAGHWGHLRGALQRSINVPSIHSILSVVNLMCSGTTFDLLLTPIMTRSLGQ